MYFVFLVAQSGSSPTAMLWWPKGFRSEHNIFAQLLSFHEKNMFPHIRPILLGKINTPSYYSMSEVLYFDEISHEDIYIDVIRSCLNTGIT